MEHAIAFAETGHLCLGTLHANSANQAIDRIINFFPEERRNQLLMDLSANLRSIVSQRLVRTEDGKGRKAAIEILLNTPTIAERIFKGAFGEIKALMEKSRELGMRTFDWALFELYNDGHIGYEEALRNADSANELRLAMKLKSKRGEPASCRQVAPHCPLTRSPQLRNWKPCARRSASNRRSASGNWKTRNWPASGRNVNAH
jgi:twitching motility protein PilU